MLDRLPAVAGMFYPQDPDDLQAAVNQYLLSGTHPQRAPKALIVPHAGYIYSGSVAGTAYASLAAGRDTIKRVILMGPSHRVPVIGLATCSAERFSTPLGTVSVDLDSIAALQRFPQVHNMDEAHILEHSLEVQLPFLQTMLNDFTLVPIVVGDSSISDVSMVLDELWGGDETLIVISSDLSHYHDYETAQQMDARTSHAIEAMDPEKIQYDDACGKNPVRGLLQVARQRHYHVKTLELQNSGDTAGPRNQVVGYGAYLFYQ